MFPVSLALALVASAPAPLAPFDSIQIRELTLARVSLP